MAKKGVICERCNTYWHYSCVGTSKNEIETKYRGIPFYCKQHRQNEKQKEREQENGKETKTYHGLITISGPENANTSKDQENNPSYAVLATPSNTVENESCKNTTITSSYETENQSIKQQTTLPEPANNSIITEEQNTPSNKNQVTPRKAEQKTITESNMPNTKHPTATLSLKKTDTNNIKERKEKKMNHLRKVEISSK